MRISNKIQRKKKENNAKACRELKKERQTVSKVTEKGISKKKEK